MYEYVTVIAHLQYSVPHRLGSTIGRGVEKDKLLNVYNAYICECPSA